MEQKRLGLYQSMDHKREALQLLDLENINHLFNEMIQRASKCILLGDVSSSSKYGYSEYSNGSTQSFGSSDLCSTSFSASSTSGVLNSSGKEAAKRSGLFTRYDIYVTKSKANLYDHDLIGIRTTLEFVQSQIVDSTLEPLIKSVQDGDKLCLIRLASLIEASSKKGIKELNLQNKLLDHVEWLPDSCPLLNASLVHLFRFYQHPES